MNRCFLRITGWSKMRLTEKNSIPRRLSYNGWFSHSETRNFTFSIEYVFSWIHNMDFLFTTNKLVRVWSIDWCKDEYKILAKTLKIKAIEKKIASGRKYEKKVYDFFLGPLRYHDFLFNDPNPKKKTENVKSWLWNSPRREGDPSF